MNTEQAFVAQPAHQQTQQEWQQVQDVAGITYLSAGQGRPILLLHGVGGAARQFAPQLAHFGKTGRAIAWDMPGYGGSVPLPVVTIDALAAALGGFIRALGLERPVLVGHSLGGMIVQRLLTEAPHVASAVVLAQTSAAFGGRDPAWAENFLRERLGPLDEGRSMAELAPGMVAAMVGDGADPAGIALAEDCLAHTPDATYRDSIQAMPGFDMREALARIAVPTLILAGSRDPNAPPAGMERMAARIPGARFVVLEGAGHLAHLEQPGRFNAAIEAFLQEVP
jgi:pimeloyl-ACP methyl ester carboxylesterase